MSGGKALLEQITITLKNDETGNLLPVYIDVYDNSLSRKWLAALNNLIKNNYHLEKNYCFIGFTESARNAEYICEQINKSINAINESNLGYIINEHFSIENTINAWTLEDLHSGGINHEKFNRLHRYFEELQGQSGRISQYYNKADAITRWHIRQLNLLCHEYESLVLSMRKADHAPMWKRPSQLMCWLHAPRFRLEESDYELFGIESLNRPLGGVFVGVNKSVGKHHWEVFNDEGRDSRIGDLTTSALISQTEAAGDFDIEWANNPGEFPWQKHLINEFRTWLVTNGFDPEDKKLSIGHPQVGQVNLMTSFGTTEYSHIWKMLGTHLDVFNIKTTEAYAEYLYNWSDADFIQRQVAEISKHQ